MKAKVVLYSYMIYNRPENKLMLNSLWFLSLTVIASSTFNNYNRYVCR